MIVVSSLGTLEHDGKRIVLATSPEVARAMRRALRQRWVVRDRAAIVGDRIIESGEIARGEAHVRAAALSLPDAVIVDT